jgi:hypothetical protein
LFVERDVPVALTRLLSIQFALEAGVTAGKDAVQFAVASIKDAAAHDSRHVRFLAASIAHQWLIILAGAEEASASLRHGVTTVAASTPNTAPCLLHDTVLASSRHKRPAFSAMPSIQHVSTAPAPSTTRRSANLGARLCKTVPYRNVDAGIEERKGDTLSESENECDDDESGSAGCDKDTRTHMRTLRHLAQRARGDPHAFRAFVSQPAPTASLQQAQDSWIRKKWTWLLRIIGGPAPAERLLQSLFAMITHVDALKAWCMFIAAQPLQLQTSFAVRSALERVAARMATAGILKPHAAFVVSQLRGVARSISTIN